ncbi:hypothetical protein TWF694_003596 [Orbilia ellipsospora]|uniref:F-box domain-containing protein n=1 Tax=Orbilia ellipsospora TaxID=2528407 RepID=A0AAV9WYP4_9PEZI
MSSLVTKYTKSRRSAKRPQTLTILHLPIELQIEILSYLSLKDQISVSQTRTPLATLLLNTLFLQKRRYARTKSRYIGLPEDINPEYLIWHDIFSTTHNFLQAYPRVSVVWANQYGRLMLTVKSGRVLRYDLRSKRGNTRDDIIQRAMERREQELAEDYSYEPYTYQDDPRFVRHDITNSPFLDDPFALPSKDILVSGDTESKAEGNIQVPIIINIRSGFLPKEYIFSDTFWEDRLTISKTASVRQWIDKVLENVYQNCRFMANVSDDKLKISMCLTKGYGGALADGVMVASVTMWKDPGSGSKEELALLGKQKFTKDPGKWFKGKYTGVKSFLGK